VYYNTIEWTVLQALSLLREEWKELPKHRALPFVVAWYVQQTHGCLARQKNYRCKHFYFGIAELCVPAQRQTPSTMLALAGSQWVQPINHCQPLLLLLYASSISTSSSRFSLDPG